MESQYQQSVQRVFPHKHTCHLGTVLVQQVLSCRSRTFHSQLFHPERKQLLIISLAYLVINITLNSCLLGLFAGSKFIGCVESIPSFISDHLSFLSLKHIDFYIVIRKDPPIPCCAENWVISVHDQLVPRLKKIWLDERGGTLNQTEHVNFLDVKDFFVRSISQFIHGCYLMSCNKLLHSTHGWCRITCILLISVKNLKSLHCRLTSQTLALFEATM